MHKIYKLVFLYSLQSNQAKPLKRYQIMSAMLRHLIRWRMTREDMTRGGMTRGGMTREDMTREDMTRGGMTRWEMTRLCMTRVYIIRLYRCIFTYISSYACQNPYGYYSEKKPT